MRSPIASLVFVILAGACASAPPDESVAPGEEVHEGDEAAEIEGDEGEETEEADAQPVARAPVEGELEPEVVGVHMISFFVVYEALRDGDWRQFELFMGAPFEYEREQSIGEQAPERVEVGVKGARAWLDGVAASWDPACNENPDPPCLSMNPLSVGYEDYWEIELRCVPEAEGSEVVCCQHEAALLHNTPFLVGVCFDAAQRVTKISVLDG